MSMPVSQPLLDPSALGRRVRKEREALGWSVRELARQTGLRRYTIQAIEDGGGYTGHTLLVLCHAFCKSPNDLMGWEDTGGQNFGRLS